MVSSFLAVLIFVRFADEFGASGNIETKELGKKTTNVTIMLFITHLLWELKVFLRSSPPFQVWSLFALKKMKTGICV